MPFTFYDPTVETTVIAGRRLPHWFQPGATYFVTFRTADSVPAAVVKEFEARRTEWLFKRGINTREADWHDRLPAGLRREYHITFTDAFHEYLDRGMGACPLRSRDTASVVSNALKHFDGQRYELADFVVMPNHVHVLFGIRDGCDVTGVRYSWKKFTATGVNRILGRSGRFWQEESFDHIARSEEHFWYYRDYIAYNPRKAGLKPGEFNHYSANLETGV